MRIEWLNDERTKVRLTRGWIWKRQAIVERTGYLSWYFVGGSEKQFTTALWYDQQWLEARRNEAIHESDWQPVAKLPTARTVKP